MRKGINEQLLTRGGAGDLGSAGRIAGGGRSECHLGRPLIRVRPRDETWAK